VSGVVGDVVRNDGLKKRASWEDERYGVGVVVSDGRGGLRKEWLMDVGKWGVCGRLPGCG